MLFLQLALLHSFILLSWYAVLSESLEDVDYLLEFRQGLLPSDNILSDWNSANTNNICHWKGIQCDGTLQRRVVSIQLSGLELRGTLSPALEQLKLLQKLNLSSNHFTLSPKGFEMLPPSLQVLDLSNNNFTGEVPSSIVELQNLVTLDLKKNGFTGNFPDLTGCTKLSRLDLSSNNLTGDIMEQVEQLKELRYLNLGGNSYLTGKLLNFSTWPQLETLDISWNKFSGNIPTNLSTGVKWLDISHNQLQGEIPDMCSERSELTFLDASGNNLTGEIPASFGMCSRLESLQVCYNDLTGKIPSTLRNCPRLRELKTDHNNLHGDVFEDFPSFPSLASLEISRNGFTGDISRVSTLSTEMIVFNLAHNKFHGSLPDRLCSWKRLMYLSLANNTLSGKIPDCLGNLSHLQILDVSNNRLIGSLPGGLEGLAGYRAPLKLTNSSRDAEIQELTGTNKHAFDVVKDGVPVSYKHILDDLKLFDVSNNMLEGNIPSELGQLVGIRFLNLSHNAFTGRIPPELSNLVSMLSLDLSNNHLRGPIPLGIASIQLSSFSVANNNLSGPIPTGNVFNTKFAASSFQGNPGLYGCPLTKTCAATGPAEIGQLGEDEKNGSDGSVFACSFSSAFLVSFVTTLWVTLATRRRESAVVEG